MSKNKTREFTEREKLRSDKLAATTTALEAEGFRRTDLTVNLSSAMLIALGIWIAYSMLSRRVFSLFHPAKFNLSTKDTVILICVILVAIVIHEALHGITMCFFVKDKRSIDFGFVPQRFTPYCTCTEALTRTQYCLVCLMPFLVLGVLMSIIAVCFNSYFLLRFSNLMVFGAGGDLTILFKLFKYKSSAKKQLVVDHPTEGGCVIFEK